MTNYLRFVTRLTFVHITDDKLKLISTHSIQVTAAVLLAEAGKDGTHIKLRLWWLSNCYMVYLRNTDIIMIQQNAL